MFTAMVRRPLVWLLAILALLGAGWAVYGPLPQAWRPVTDTAERGPQSAPGAEAQSSAPAGSTDGRAAEAPPAAAAPGPPAAELAPPARQLTETPAAPEAATAEPGAPVPTPQLAERPAAPPQPPEPPAESASRPAPYGRPPGAPPGDQESAPPLASVEPARRPEPSSAAVQEARQGTTAEPQVGELAPAAGPPTAPAASLTPLERSPERPVTAAATEAAAALSPAPAAPAVIGPSEEPPASAAALPEPGPQTPQPPPAAIERPSAAPEVAETAPLPATEPARPAMSPETAAPPSERSLSFDTIRRALAALLGGAPKPTDPEAQKIDRPASAAQVVKPGEPAERAGAGAPELIRPSFDLVRVEPGGRAVVAGRAAPGAEVEVLAGERVLDRVRADGRGEWVALPPEPLPAGGLELSLRATSGGAPAVEAKQVVVVVVPEPPPPQPPPVAVAESPPPQPAEVRLADAPAGPLAVLLTEDGRAPGRILQAPGRISSDGQLALLVLDYDDSGRTRLTGEAPPGAPLRIYVDNRPAAEAVTGPSGKWTAVLEHDLAPGEYTLRLDQLGEDGRPVARLETPFTRVSQPPIQGKAQVDYVIVQPGNSLWRIARRLFGHGLEYVQIYDANKAQIRDPDLIYPGQVFEIPAGVGSSG
jgi:nucleoid-associated protein YgaU